MDYNNNQDCNNQDFTIEFTKLNKLLEVNNDMVHNYYFIQYGKIYNKLHTKYRKFKYVICFDVFDLEDYYMNDDGNVPNISDADIRYYASEFTPSELYNIKSYNDIDSLKKFFAYCNDTIKDYNRIV